MSNRCAVHTLKLTELRHCLLKWLYKTHEVRGVSGVST